MAPTARVMRLTAEHVARVTRPIPDPGPQQHPGHRAPTDTDFADAVAGMLASRPPGAFWLFGYGSLIWRPETAFEEHRMATARGWHRRFCLGNEHRYRGNPQQPGVMMALDRGGSCKGVIYRLPEDGLEAELDRLIRREQSTVPLAFPWRWIEVEDENGDRLRVLAFAMNRKSTRYVGHLSDEAVADLLATACGFRGSMAEYLYATVSKLEELGIHDRNLWRMQELVAERIEARHVGDR